MEGQNLVFYRDEYGMLFAPAKLTNGWNAPENPAYQMIEQAKSVATLCASRKRLPVAYDDMSWEKCGRRGNKKIGYALHHEIYDISVDMKKILVCCRETEGTKYGIKTVSKRYYLLCKHGATGYRIREVSKAIAAKTAKSAGKKIGGAIKKLLKH